MNRAEISSLCVAGRVVEMTDGPDPGNAGVGIRDAHILGKPNVNRLKGGFFVFRF